jgi:hypothetical protein
MDVSEDSKLLNPAGKVEGLSEMVIIEKIIGKERIMNVRRMGGRKIGL